jgi:hypothetical protein
VQKEGEGQVRLQEIWDMARWRSHVFTVAPSPYGLDAVHLSRGHVLMRVDGTFKR